MKTSGIGGQAVIEGIMMRNKDDYAVAVRKENGEIAVIVDKYQSIIKNKKLTTIPFVRGFFSFIDSMVLGVRTLSWAADQYAIEDGETDDITKDSSKEYDEKESGSLRPDDKKAKDQQGLSPLMMAGTVVFSFALAIGIFVLLPFFLSNLLRQYVSSPIVIALIEGLLRLLIFIAYVAGISLMKDIKRVYMYHGAEHKCINCIEHGLPLTVENVRISSKEHRRCGTSFILFVILFSIIIGMFIRVRTMWLKLIIRILLIPVIAGFSYEFIKLAGRSNSKVMEVLSKPGLWMQALTVKEPDDSMIEVAIKAVESVFDWKEFLKEYEEQ